MLLSCSSSNKDFSEEKWHSQVKNTNPSLLYAPHVTNGKYFNPWMPMKDRNFFNFLEWKFTKNANSYTDQEKSYLPKVLANPLERIQALGDSDFIMWVGHNTFLFRIDGTYFIVDPIFSDRALLPKRVTPPGISINELKQLTTKINVIITHNHYDHLDEDSIKQLPPHAVFYVPLGLKDYFISLGRNNVVELDWWQEFSISDKFKIISLPKQHWSKRVSQSTNSTLWASYMLISPQLTIYIAGDSGYFIGYREYGKRFPKIDYALLPTTAYHPRWFMHYVHMNVDEALMAFDDLGAKYFIPTQWGTFALGEEPPGFPALDLKRKIAEKGLDPHRFLIMDIGGIELLHKHK
ncbi:MAG: MBL fold metallo-hydrolase [Spirochaetes bacterium]|nr:MBL fold metallo-hydrolase [Spirochaetota bacterium]